MTIASHRRRLDARAPTERPLTLAELLEDSDEQKAAKAVKAVCAFARALVAPVPATPGARHSSGAVMDEQARPSAEVTSRGSRAPDARPRKTEPERLDPREVVTFEEAMKQPWIGLEPIKPSVPPEDRPPQPRRPKGWIDPWGGGGFLFPSYARDEQE